MSYVNPIWLEGQRQRFLRHDAHRFTKPEPIRRKSYAERVLEERQAEQESAEKEALRDDLQHLRWLVKDLKIDLEIRRMRLKYRPDQPRDDRGRWVDDAEKEGNEEPAISTDFSSVRRRSPSGAFPDATPAQQARLAAAEARAQDAMRLVRERDPNWRPSPSAYETIEGAISARQAEAREADARLTELQYNGIGPGRYAADSISARGPGRRFTAEEIEQNNANGEKSGCHTCGIHDPKTRSGNYVPDHQPPTMWNPFNSPQRLFPQCLTCSSRQGGWISTNRR
jgi:hypothetical protein